MRFKKSQGLSITTIIVAAIALIVLVVLIAIFTGRVGVFSKGLSKVGTCESLGGICLDVQSCSEAGSSGNPREIFGATDCGKDLESQGGQNLKDRSKCCGPPK
jgi:hypothetical protein